MEMFAMEEFEIINFLNFSIFEPRKFFVAQKIFYVLD
jgi:hypothetical protein